MLEDYRKDYSVYCLRVELKTLGRLKQDKDRKFTDESLKQIDKQMDDIRSTLQLLKEKHGLIRRDRDKNVSY